MPVPVTPKAEANLTEIFSSLQGEGILVGCRQIFLRFAECNLNCRYCDTDFSKTEFCRVEPLSGAGPTELIANPVGQDSLLKLVNRWCREAPGAHHSISLTGGEPLLQQQTLAEWLPQLRKLLPIYLETNGTLPELLAPLLAHLDWISMDIKLHSQTGLTTDWDVHRRFLQLANKRNCYVKVVVGVTTPDSELQMAAELITEVSKSIPLILQPVTVDHKVSVSPQRLMAMQQRVAVIHENVRIIPQTHVFMDLI